MAAEPLPRFLQDFTHPRWLALWAAMLGYLLDAMDVLFYLFALQSIRAEFGLSLSQAGLVTAATMAASSIGGTLCGVLADRIGRRRALILSILMYSFASAGSAFSTGLESLIFWRALVGLGLGGEWSAGAVLVAESWPTEHRAKAISFMQSGWALGYMVSALLSALVLPRFGWRALFLIGVLPALLTLMIRRKVVEPAIWAQGRERPGFATIFRPPLLRRTVLATILATSMLLGYWGLFSWLPGFLAGSRETGGAGLTLVKSGMWIFVMQAGAYAGYLCFGLMADRYGRRPAFLIYVLAAAALTPVYGLIPGWAGDSAERWLLILGPFIGFFGTGFFSLFGAMLAELYPTAVRGTGQGFTYNTGRAVSAFAPYLIGAAADRMGLGPALAANAGFFLLGAVLIFALPETRSSKLDEVL
ncbi:MAG: MFS transporter [Acidobacteria bacterium]|nr:MFS transporter [Acidobacteriota bacterium]